MESQNVELEKQASEDKLLLPKAADLFFLSFRFSQGDPPLQRNIFNYLVLEHPHWRVSENFNHDLMQIVTPRIENFLSGRRVIAHSPEFSGIEGNIRGEIKEMTALFNRNNSIKDRKTVLSEITNRIIDRDHYWLVEKKGRPRNLKSKSRGSSVADTFLSHLCYYALEGNKTGASEYDKMFQETKETLWEMFSKEEKPFGNYKIAIRHFVEVANKYVATHPDKKEVLQKKIPDYIRAQITSLSL